MTRMAARTAAWLPALAGMLGVLTESGCHFDSASNKLSKNTCSIDDDCADTSVCREGMCVGKTSMSLDLSVEVTPQRMPDGSQPVPIGYGPFSLYGGTHRTFDLPQPATITGNVREGDKHVAAELHFTPMRDAALPPPTAQVVTTNMIAADESAPSGDDFSVQLLEGVQYHMVVEPTDATLPPYTRDFIASNGLRLDTVDYAKVRWTVQSFYVQGAPPKTTLALRAIDAKTGEPISSTQEFTGKKVTLLFGPLPTPEYKLEITTEDSYATVFEPGKACDHTTPVFPVLRVAQSALRDDEAGTHVFVMPEIPAPVEYAGVVQLCPGNQMKGLTGMPMALDARTLHWGGDVNVDASYNATTAAALDENGELHFCANVLPGEYVVVITPPANLECEIFAEHRVIDAPTSAPGAGVTLALRAPTVLRGTIRTPDGNPVNAAAIEAHALGRDVIVEGDSIARYNRSTQSASDARGKFRVPIDLGSYDVVFKPPPQSNFAWHVLHDVNVDGSQSSLDTAVDIEAPVVIEAKLRYPDATSQMQHLLAGAEVHVYARVDSDGGSRTIEVARTVADEKANLTLLISPKLHTGL